MKGIARLLALVAIVCGGAALYNVTSDQAPLESVARRTACATRAAKAPSLCRLQLRQLARSPFKQAYLYTSNVAVDCVRRWVFFGEYTCTVVTGAER